MNQGFWISNNVTDEAQQVNASVSESEKRADLLSVREKQLLFKTNFRKQFDNDLSCSLCKDPDSEESLSHL